MRITFGVLIIAFVATASVQAQTGRDLSMRDLVELSRAERARRAGQPIEGRIYTSDDIARFVPPVPDGTAALGEDVSGGTIEMLETFESEGQGQLEQLQTELANPSLTAEERSQIQADIIEVQDMLSELGVELQSARQRASDLGSIREEVDVFQAEIDDAERAQAVRIEARAAWQEQLAAKLAEIQDELLSRVVFRRLNQAAA